MKIVTCRGRGEGGGGGEKKREVKGDSLMKSYITLVSVHLVFKILACDKIYLNVLFLNNDQFKKRGKILIFRVHQGLIRLTMWLSHRRKENVLIYSYGSEKIK